MTYKFFFHCKYKLIVRAFAKRVQCSIAISYTFSYLILVYILYDITFISCESDNIEIYIVYINICASSLYIYTRYYVRAYAHSTVQNQIQSFTHKSLRASDFLCLTRFAHFSFISNRYIYIYSSV